MYIFAGLSKFPIKFSRSNSFPNRKSVEYDEKNIALMMNGLDFNMQNLILLSQHYKKLSGASNIIGGKIILMRPIENSCNNTMLN